MAASAVTLNDLEWPWRSYASGPYHRLHAFSNAFCWTFVQHFTQFQLTACSHSFSALAELLVIKYAPKSTMNCWKHCVLHLTTPTYCMVLKSMATHTILIYPILEILNNKILRIVQKRPKRTHTTDLYKFYDTLPLPEIFQGCEILECVNWPWPRYLGDSLSFEG